MIDGATGAAPDQIRLGADVHGIAVDAARGVVYVTVGKDTLAVIDRRSRRIVQKIATGANPNGVAVDPLDGSVAVANTYGGNVSLFTLGRRYKTTTA